MRALESITDHLVYNLAYTKILQTTTTAIIFPLYHVIVRPIKIIKDLLKDCKIQKSMSSEKIIVSTRCICGFKPNSNKKS